MPSSSSAPSRAVPILAAILVATSRRHALRHLDEGAFQRAARGCDHFIAWTTLPGFAVAVPLLPQLAGVYVILGFSLWGLFILLVVGSRVSNERRRRKRLAS